MVDLRFDVDSPPSVTERVIASTPRIALGLAFVLIGTTKFGPHSSWISLFQRLGTGDWLRYFTGIMQVGGGLLALIPRTALVGAVMIGCTMAGAVFVDLFVLRFGPVAVIPFTLLVVSAGVAWQAWNRD